jgi:hypothetical protein
MIKYTFYWVSKLETNKKYEIFIELPHLITVTEAIRDVIPYFNEKLGSEGS